MARSLAHSLTVIAGLSLLVAAVESVLFVKSGYTPLWAFAIFPAGALVHVGCGLLAWWRRPGNAVGPLISVAALALFVVGLANTGVPALMIPAVVVATIPLAFVVHMLLAFPAGRLPSAPSRVTVIAGYVVAVGLQTPLYLFDPHASPDGTLAVADTPGLVAAGTWVQRAAGMAVMVTTAVILGARIRQAGPDARRALLPLYVYGSLVVVLTPLLGSVLPEIGFSGAVSATVQVALVGGVPLAFVVTLLRGGFARTSEVHELATWLGIADPLRPTLTAAIARALGDDSVQVVFWVPDDGRYVDSAGEPVELPPSGAPRAAFAVEADGRRIGAICYDATLSAPELVRPVAAVAAIAMEREQLTAALYASGRALQDSRERIVAAADRERRRIAQDLHDGLQARLVLLAIETQQLADVNSSDAARRAISQLRAGIDAAADELRAFVYDVMPAPLIERGLRAAAEDLTDRLPLPTRLDLQIGDARLPAAVEGTAYFVISETLANVTKHAQASCLSVRIAIEAETLRIEVADDGVGGAVVGDGLGLRGISDRVAAFGGRVTVRSADGAGTTLIAEMPCES